MSTAIGLEIWLIGTPAEEQAAARMLARLGVVAYRSHPAPMAGADAGRVRAYARVRVTTTTAVAAPTTPDRVSGLLDLAA